MDAIPAVRLDGVSKQFADSYAVHRLDLDIEAGHFFSLLGPPACGITFVFVTHDQDEALTMSDRIAVMSEGRIQQCGTPEDVYEHPASRFVASFMGTSNLMTGTYRGGEVALDQGPALAVGSRSGLA